MKKRSGRNAIVPSSTWKTISTGTARGSSSSFFISDIVERGFWDEYMQAYEACLSATSTQRAPWYVVPADDKENARLIIARIVVDAFKSLGMQYPQTDAQHRQELLSIRQQLVNEAPDS